MGGGEREREIVCFLFSFFSQIFCQCFAATRKNSVTISDDSTDVPVMSGSGGERLAGVPADAAENCWTAGQC